MKVHTYGYEPSDTMGKLLEIIKLAQKNDVIQVRSEAARQMVQRGLDRMGKNTVRVVLVEAEPNWVTQ